ncbi:MAG: 4-alpha-glucanotransferase [Clostridia bacterium]|nr:4-alpha-glucanotransferase [Clostridia bacterium]
MKERAAGILLHISSLPSKYGIGCFSKTAYDFVDWLYEAGQTYWQILPVGPTSFGDSPYQSFSTFAGNPYFISLEALIDEGVLTEEECDAADFGDRADDISFDKLYHNRYPLLRKACSRSDLSRYPEYKEFVRENEWWLADYALYMAVKDSLGGIPWQQWPEDISLRREEAIEKYSEELKDDIEFYQYLQFKFFEQYSQLKAYANKKGIRIVGDIPIYVSMDSADAWANPELFQLDEKHVPVAVAGCPPDGFTADGQLWGNPLYRWDYHKEQGFEWWISRLKYCFELYDVTRIDHFRGFDEYYSIPYGEKTARNGHWEKGPGIELFRAVEAKLGKNEVIAEDLGYMTDTVRQMLKDSGFPGMKVLEFAFDARDSSATNDYLPHNYPVNSVVYTGTHDNETIAGWFDSISKDEQQMARDYLCDSLTPKDELYKPFVSLVMRSKARTCIIPIQDYLGLDNAARMNTPSTIGINWRWRLKEGQLTDELQAYILKTTRLFGRVSKKLKLQKEAEEKAAEVKIKTETEDKA